MNAIVIFYILASCVMSLTSYLAAGGCKVNIPGDIPKNEPVYLIPEKLGGYSLYTPTDFTITLRHNSKLVMFCSGTRNNFKGYKNPITATCKGNKFQVDGKLGYVNFKRFTCNQRVSASVRETREPCANGQGVIKDIGFLVTTSEFVKLFEVCYNNVRTSAIYSRHHINGKSNHLPASRIEFKETAIPNHAHPSESYTRAAVKKRFLTVLGSQNFFTSPNHLDRGHLTPVADFVFRWGQFATFFFINVVPQYNADNNGNWKKVEEIARKLASSYKTQLLVYTGTYGQLELPNDKGKLVPLWLEDGNRIEVPKWMWKVVIDEKTKAGVAFVSLNNPFPKKKNEITLICKDVCDDTGLNTEGFDRIPSGYTYCCHVNELARVIGVLPQSVSDIKNLLKNPKKKFMCRAGKTNQQCVNPLKKKFNFYRNENFF